MSKRIAVLVVSTLVVLLVAAIIAFVVIRPADIKRSLERASLPQETNYQELKNAGSLPTSGPLPTTKISTAPPAGGPPPSSVSAPAEQTNLPAEINLAIPFTSQAPHGRWETPYKEFCEEASVLMVTRYLQNQSIGGPDEAAAAMLDIQAFEQQEFGYWEDTTAQEVATILEKHFKTEAELIVDPTVEDIKRALAAGKPVIMPAAGRLLGNPFYTPPGPLYHMLVIKGYTAKNQFITHDPGTRRGADFLYDPATIMNALHDWRPDGNVEQGRKVILIVG